MLLWKVCHRVCLSRAVLPVQLEMVVQAGEHSHSPVPIARYMGSEIYKKVGCTHTCTTHGRRRYPTPRNQQGC